MWTHALVLGKYTKTKQDELPQNIMIDENEEVTTKEICLFGEK